MSTRVGRDLAHLFPFSLNIFSSPFLFLLLRSTIVCRNRRNRRIPFHMGKSKFSVETLTETFIVFSCKWIQRKTDHRFVKTRKSDQDLRRTNEINFDDAAKKSLDDTYPSASSRYTPFNIFLSCIFLPSLCSTSFTPF